MDEILTVKDLVKHYPIRKGVFSKTVGYVRAVNGVSFSISKGSTLGLVGESGCGKTTTGRVVLRLVEPTSGEILFEGRNVLEMSSGELRELRRQAQIVFQDPFGSLNPRMTVGVAIEEPMVVHGASLADNGGSPARSIVARGSSSTAANKRGTARDKTAELLKLVGLPPESADRYPHEFSGGQRQRVCIARALALSPKLIVCDEPVSALDVSVQAQILNLLVELRGRFNLTYLFIAHDLAVVKHISHRVAVMYLGEIVEEGPTEEMFRSPLHPYTQALLSSIPVPYPRGNMTRTRLHGELPSPTEIPAGCPFQPRCPIAIEECKRVKPELVELRPDHRVACIRA